MAQAKKSARANQPVFFAKPAAFRAWLKAHHDSRTELFVGFYKKGSGKPSITWSEAVDEALCFGWIDGVLQRLAEDAYSLRFTPRKPTSNWSKINVEKVAKLTTLGKMHASGLRAFAARKPEKTGIYSFERVTPAKLDPAQATALRDNPKARAFFEAQPPWYQRAATHWIVGAKREETRERRLQQLIADSAAGRSIKPLKRRSGSA